MNKIGVVKIINCFSDVTLLNHNQSLTNKRVSGVFLRELCVHQKLVTPIAVNNYRL